MAGRIVIESPDDPRIRPYRDLRRRDLARREGLFVAEGEHLVRQLLESRLHTRSVLLSQRRAASTSIAFPAGVPIYVAPQGVLEGIAGFPFHRGMLACGMRPRPPSLEEILAGAPPRAILAVCPAVASAENLGSLVRVCAAFDVLALVLGPGGCDPFARRVVRVSMGGVLRLPIARLDDLEAGLADLARHRGFERIATVAHGEAEPLAGAPRPERAAVLFGGEAEGLPARLAGACERRIRIPLAPGTESLNLAVAAGIVLHHLASL